ncbi:unnamed protein product [Psylliodes chrysocephalus]|uniref:Peptidase S1 domain-containing protein n=1 Tax=Psylliodes chrysocephalus TaxID=3402493 RepID=A0A9P0D629_9CUCU|nr:unnamed protein product [Psylliodes chrysocephala]
MLKFVFLVAILAVCAAFPKSEFRTTFIHPTNRQSKPLSDGLTIINGQTARPHQFPYQVGMYVKTPLYTDFCGGSLISKHYVLTAAHCVDKALSVKLVFGAQNVSDPSEKSQVRVASESFVVHPGWDEGNLVNDIALIRLSTPISETNAIKIVPLAKGSNTFANQNGAVAGWGLTKTSQKGVTPVLNYINTAIMSNDDCRKFNNDYYTIVKDTHLCISAGAAKSSTCQGDSGGPLAVNGIQVGVVSFGAPDCESGKPSVFTRVTEFQDWIAQNSDVKF